MEEANFLINDNFNDKSYKLKIPYQKKKEYGMKSKKKIQEKAFVERKYVTQAKIMMIMKEKRKMKHNDLFHEICIQQSELKFKVGIPLFKKCIQILIDKDYLLRSEEDRKTYMFQP